MDIINGTKHLREYISKSTREQEREYLGDVVNMFVKASNDLIATKNQLTEVTAELKVFQDKKAKEEAEKTMKKADEDNKKIEEKRKAKDKKDKELAEEKKKPKK